MSSIVTIKSFPNGISVFLNGEAEFPVLLEEVGKKFRESASFFKNAKMALSFEGRELSEEEERLLVSQITGSCGLQILCLIGKDEEKSQMFLKAVQQAEKREADSDEGKVYKGNLTKGQALEREDSLVIIGDVYPGAAVISKQDIIVIGGLYGEAHAGADGSDGHFVIALDLSPERLRLGLLDFDASKKPGKWPIRPKIVPKIAYEKGGLVVADPVTKELLNRLPIF